jgi:BlaI family transcriptional regulator, penicillinase repressor
MDDLGISDAEWLVMQVVWDLKAATAADVIAQLGPEAGWSHRTIRTLLGRLVEKKVLAAQPDGNRYVYRPLVTRTQCVRKAGKSFLERVFGGDCGELLMHFARQGKVAPEQIAKLRKLLEEHQDPKE